MERSQEYLGSANSRSSECSKRESQTLTTNFHLHWTRIYKSLGKFCGCLPRSPVSRSHSPRRAYESQLSQPSNEDGVWTQEGRVSSALAAIYTHPRATTYFTNDVHYSTQKGDSHVLVCMNDTLWSRAPHSTEVGGPV